MKALPVVALSYLILGSVTLTGLSKANPLASAPAAPVIVGDAEQFDFVSEITGEKYRVFVGKPVHFDPAKKHPAFYLLDANYYFTAAKSISHYSARSSRVNVMPGIVVGVGYPTDDLSVVGKRRTYSYTPATDGPSGVNGGIDDFIRVLLNEIQPFVSARYNVDPARQSIFGKSLGGLAVLRIMLRHSNAFSRYIAASPVVEWFNNGLLKDEATFVQRARSGEMKVELMITMGGAEPPAFIQSAEDLAGRLSGQRLDNLRVTFVRFPDENHTTVSLAALSRGLHFGLQGSGPPRGAAKKER